MLQLEMLSEIDVSVRDFRFCYDFLPIVSMRNIGRRNLKFLPELLYRLKKNRTEGILKIFSQKFYRVTQSWENS